MVFLNSLKYNLARYEDVLMYYINHERPCLTTFHTEMGVENTTRSGVFLTSLEVFGNVVKHCLECFFFFFFLKLIKSGKTSHQLQIKSKIKYIYIYIYIYTCAQHDNS